MPTEEGIVVRSDGSGTWVKTRTTGACEGCSSRGACHALGGSNEREVAAANPLGAVVGDRVVLKVDTSPLLKATFLIYLFPILMLMAGAGVGEWLSHSAGWGSSMPAAMLGFGSLAAGLVLVRVWGRRLSQQSAYRPRIIRVVGRVRLESQADEKPAG